MSDTKVRVFLDIDINHTREAYQRAKDFVAARNLAYNLSSNDLEELGGSEKKRVKDTLYPNDFEWSQKGRICLRMPPERLVFEVWPKVAPYAVDNFLGLVRGNKGKGESGKPLHYKGCRFHRVVRDFVAQGGDFVHGNGSGGESIWGKKFKDDKDGLKVKLDRRGLLAMGNSGKNSNTSQFFITFKELPRLNGKHVVFGELVEGEEVLKLVESCAAEEGASREEPKYEVVIADCGVLE